MKGARAWGGAGGKNAGLNHVGAAERAGLSGREVCGMREVAGKSMEITQNEDCEGSIPAPD